MGRISEHFPQRTYRWPPGTWKDAHHYYHQGNANQTQEIHLAPVRMATIKKAGMNKCWQGGEEKQTLDPAGGNADWGSRCRKQRAVPPKTKIQNYPRIQQFHFWVFIWRNETRPWKDIYVPLFTAVLFTIAETWKQPKCPPADERA